MRIKARYVLVCRDAKDKKDIEVRPGEEADVLDSQARAFVAERAATPVAGRVPELDEAKSNKTDEARQALEDRATELGVKFTSRISDEGLTKRIEEAEKADGDQGGDDQGGDDGEEGENLL